MDEGLPLPILIKLIQIYSFDIDFQRDIQKGDNFQIIFDGRKGSFYIFLLKTSNLIGFFILTQIYFEDMMFLANLITLLSYY